jgi:hypothetical protein
VDRDDRLDSSPSTSADRLGDLLTRSNSHRLNLAAEKRFERFGRETPSNKASRSTLEATGALLVLAALAVFFALPSHAGIVGVTLLIAGLLLAWSKS